MQQIFSFKRGTLDIKTLTLSLKNINCGAFVAFEGRVRIKNNEKDVSYLEYEGSESLAKIEFNKIVDEAKGKYNIKDVLCMHRIGKLSVGDISILLGASAIHRKEAFLGCEYLITELKKRLPIWKKEIYTDKNFTWIDESSQSKALNETKEKIFYYKQKKIKEIGENGQLMLRNSKILIIGIGGLGCSALQYLASAGIGEIGLCDGDQIELSNLHRQTIFKFNDCGKYKTKIAANFISNLNPFIKVNKHNEYISSENYKLFFNKYDLILDCTDNINTKFLINDLAYLNKIPLIRASIYQFEGHIEFFKPNISPCLRCLWDKIPENNCIKSCADSGVLGVIPGILGIYQANEAIKYFLKLKTLDNNKIILINLIENKFHNLITRKNNNCILCGKNPIITDIYKENYKNKKLNNENLINIEVK